MRGISTIFLGSAMGLAMTAGVHGTTLLFDLGDDDEVENINYIVFDSQTSVVGAVDTDGNATGIEVTLKSATGFNENGPNWNAGTSSPSGDAAMYFDSEMTMDSLYGHSDGFLGLGPRPYAEYEISGLNQGVAYTFTMFGSRMDVNVNNLRETKYTLMGAASSSALLEITNNSSDVAQLTENADASGNLVLRIEAGPNNNVGNNFYYLGAMAIEYTDIPEPASLGLLALGGCAALMRRRQ